VPFPLQEVSGKEKVWATILNSIRANEGSAPQKKKKSLPTLLKKGGGFNPRNQPERNLQRSICTEEEGEDSFRKEIIKFRKEKSRQKGLHRTKWGPHGFTKECSATGKNRRARLETWFKCGGCRAGGGKAPIPSSGKSGGTQPSGPQWGEKKSHPEGRRKKERFLGPLGAKQPSPLVNRLEKNQKSQGAHHKKKKKTLKKKHQGRKRGKGDADHPEPSVRSPPEKNGDLKQEKEVRQGETKAGKPRQPKNGNVQRQKEENVQRTRPFTKKGGRKGAEKTFLRSRTKTWTN